MNTTNNLGLRMPGTSDPADVADLNYNSQILDASVTALRTLLVSCGTVSSLPKTVSNAAIEDGMVVINATLGTPSAQTGDWTVTTSAGSLTISGSISGSTTLTLYLMKSR